MPLKPESALRKDHGNAKARDVLQHRHFAVIAGVIKAMADPGFRAHTAEHFARELEDTNRNFDRDRFLKACGQ
jgi:hypothetical protein